MKKTGLLFSLIFTLSFLNAQDWEPRASLPGGIARHHPITFTIDGFGYVLTGTVFGDPSNDFMRYDPVTDTWEELPDFPGPARSYSYGTSRGSKAYVGFGAGANAPLNDLWEYDSETEEWTQLSNCPCDARLHPAFIQLDDRIYVGLGNNTENLKDWWEYDIPTDTWSQQDDLPSLARHHPFYFGIDNIAYVGFGHGSTGSPNIYNDFFKFDASTGEWTQLDFFPGEARVAGTQFDYEGKGYILSGDGDNHSHMEEGEFWEYDPALDEWTKLTSHPGSSRWAPGNFVIDNYVYFLAGLSDVQLESDMMRFELAPLATSTKELESIAISVFPNPATSEISFNEDISQFSEVYLLNNLGQRLRQLTSNEVNVQNLPDGLYYLQFFKGENSHVEKFMIVR
ncbi:MAG: T9SS type A sorting domain-containing protein [Bacteroidetes bacterium]|nr:T9SS type A sorting domain-containing protein [Bacteroidota bacterium]